MRIENDIQNVIMAQFEKSYRCVEVGKTEGIIRGDIVGLRDGYYIPAIRWYAEDNIQYAFK
jgi:hypothetical protein